ncbi:MAG: methyltransferase domain-containing protein [Blastochloris sp.]|nr:methyltransferase domain-containing protein [Blastochloris sp.]
MHSPFDALALGYDAEFTASPIARHLRRRVHARLLANVHAGDHILELGCGTGEDALFLARHGVRVTATDASAGMIAQARAKLTDEPNVRVAALDLNALPDAYEMGFDGVFANFGVLNCAHDVKAAAAWLADRIVPRGVALFAVMGTCCPWEVVWHGSHGDFRTAFRRLRGETTFTAGSETIRVRYPTPLQLTRAFAPHFTRTRLEGLGAFLPPSDVYGVIERRPRLLRVLTNLDDVTAPFTAWVADHYWIEFRRK